MRTLTWGCKQISGNKMARSAPSRPKPNLSMALQRKRKMGIIALYEGKPHPHLVRPLRQLTMASQRILLLTFGGAFADSVWQQVCHWSDARQNDKLDEWSSDDWPGNVRREIDAFIEKLQATCYTPPILYRSEHVDCWSMGDVYETALVKGHRDSTRRLYTANHQVIATWVQFSEQIIPDRDSPAETVWLYTHVNEAIGAWGKFAEDRLVILVRSVLGGLWTDEEVVGALATLPSWWTETEQSHATEPEVGPESNGQSSAPAR